MSELRVDNIVDSAGTGAVLASQGVEAFPVNSVFISVVTTNPSTLLGYGTWAAFGEGLYLVGVPSGGTGEGTAGTALTDTENRAVGQHTHTQNAHRHDQNKVDGTGGQPGTSPRGSSTNVIQQTGANVVATAVNQNAGSVAGTNAPYIQVYMWKRTA